MSEIIKKIQGLEPGSTYIINLKAINRDYNVEVDPPEAIRFTTPDEPTVPGNISGISVASNYRSLMISFDYAQDLDIVGYEYEVYEESEISDPNSVPYDLISGPIVFVSGRSDSNVITVDVSENTTIEYPDPESTSSTQNNIFYYVRVRGIDTYGNEGDWSPIVKSSALPLIEDSHIVNLTAAKITAGTIGAYEIVLGGSGSIIRSANYVHDVSGWMINGNGSAEFYEALVRSNISGGTIDIATPGFHVDAAGNMWLGSLYLSSTPPFIVDTLGNMHVGGYDSTSTHIDNTGNMWVGAGALSSTPPFIVTNTGDLHVGGYDSTSFHVDNTGNMWVGAGALSSTPPFIVKNNGELHIGGYDSTSFHIDSTGNLWIGAKDLSSTPTFKVSNQGALDIGGIDASSFHVDSSGNMWSGSGPGSYSTAPLKISNTGLFVSQTTSSSSKVQIDAGLIIVTTSSGDSIVFTEFFGVPSINSSDSISLNADVDIILEAGSGGDITLRSDSLLGGPIYLAPQGSNSLVVGTSSIVASEAFYVIDGTSALPGLSFDSDTNTGIYRVAENEIGFSTGGTLRFDISATDVVSTLPLRNQGGSSTAPSYSFSGDTNTGMYSTTADILSFTTGGTERFRVIDAGTRLISGQHLGIAADGALTPSYSWFSDEDTGMYRISAGSIGFSSNNTEILRVDSAGIDVTGDGTFTGFIDVVGEVRTDDGLLMGVSGVAQALYTKKEQIDSSYHAFMWNTLGVGSNTVFGLGIKMGIDGNTNNPSTDDRFITFIAGDATNSGSITGNATGGVDYNTTSDRRLKRNIRPMERAEEMVQSVEWTAFEQDFRPPRSEETFEMTKYGVIAQDIHENKDLWYLAHVGDPEGVEKLENPWSVNYMGFVPVIGGALSSIIDRCKSMEKQILDLKRQIKNLEK